MQLSHLPSSRLQLKPLAMRNVDFERILKKIYRKVSVSISKVIEALGIHQIN